ncbi:MAG: hypothetical protein H0U03_07060 [Actinobacteria bacterium]|nr:hypothetical protein [Actinomycetota bacterium]
MAPRLGSLDRLVALGVGLDWPLVEVGYAAGLLAEAEVSAYAVERIDAWTEDELPFVASLASITAAGRADIGAHLARLAAAGASAVTAARAARAKRIWMVFGIREALAAEAACSDVDQVGEALCDAWRCVDEALDLGGEEPRLKGMLHGGIALFANAAWVAFEAAKLGLPRLSPFAPATPPAVIALGFAVAQREVAASELVTWACSAVAGGGLEAPSLAALAGLSTPWARDEAARDLFIEAVRELGFWPARRGDDAT